MSLTPTAARAIPTAPGRRRGRLAGGLSAPLFAALLALPSIGCHSDPAPTDAELAQAGLERIRESILTNVHEGARRREALELADRLMEVEVGFLERRDRLDAELFELNADYDSDREELERIYDTFDIYRRQTVKEFLGPLGALAVVLEDDEWNAVVTAVHEADGAWGVGR